MHITLQHPFALLLLPLALCFVYCKRERTPFYLPKMEWIDYTNPLSNYHQFIQIATFVLLILALASPIAYSRIIPSDRSGRAIVLALDTSGSMRESGIDKSGKSKFEIVQDLVSDFIDKRSVDNIGIVAFGSFAFSASPVTYDHQALKTLLDMLEVEIAGKNTAIADALHQSARTLSFSRAKEKIIILLTDGMNNTGSLSINQAIDELKEKKIKVYTIGLGSPQSYDRPLLQHIASATMGKQFDAKNSKELRQVYEEIDTLHPSRLRSENHLNKKDLFLYPLLLATLLGFWLLGREEEIV